MTNDAANPANAPASMPLQRSELLVAYVMRWWLQTMGRVTGATAVLWGGVATIASVTNSAVVAALCVSGLLSLQQSVRDRDALLLNPDAPEFGAPAPPVSLVRLNTSKGVIDIEVTRDWSPRGADRFVALVRNGYYDEARFFRITPGRWAQFGINGTPAIAKAWRTRTIADDPFKQTNVRGTVAFAFAVPNGRTTQVFINLRDNSETHDKEPFTPFGRVVAGMALADALNDEYGEGPGGIRAGKQEAFFEGGNAWLLTQFPRLDFIRRAFVVRP